MPAISASRALLAGVALAGAVTLAACSATTEPGDGLHPAENRVLVRAFQSDRNGNSAVVLKRDKELFPSGCDVTVLIDRKPAIAIESGEVFTAYVEPGTHRLETKFARKCRAQSTPLSVVTHSGKAVVVRVKYVSLSTPLLEEVGEEDLKR